MFRIQRIALICMIVLLALTSVQPAVGAPLAGRTITVTSTADDLTVNGNCTLREAIQAANLDKKVDRCPAGAGADTIKLGAATYSMRRAGRVEDSNKTGDYDIRTSMTIVGAGMGKTIIELRSVDRAFDVRSTTASVILQDMTIQHGATGGANADHGGAVVNRGIMTIRRVKFLSNSTTGAGGEMGGAVWNKAKLTVTGSVFESNHSDAFGGAIGNSGSLSVDTTTFKANSAEEGGAIANAKAATATLNNNSKFYSNICGIEGAAVANYGTLSAKYNTYETNSDCAAGTFYNSGTATVRYSTFKKNEAVDGAFLNEGGTLTVSHSFLFDNEAPGGGNGVFTIRAGKVVVDKTTMQGGDAHGFRITNAELRMVNSTVTEMRGAAIGAESGSVVSLESVTLYNNNGPALTVFGGVARVHNSILAGSREIDTTILGSDCASDPGTLISSGYNLVGIADGCGWTAATGDKLGTLAARVDAQLLALAKNGGPTPTFALQSTSPAVNAADPANTVRSDQRSYVRPAGAHCDMGAFEYGAVAP